MLPGDEAITVLRQIATILHRRHFREVSRSELQERLVPEIQNEMPQTVAATRSPLDLIKNIEERSQLLVERGLNEKGEPVMAFSHLTFQEYLTSVSLKEAIGQRGEAAVSSEVLTWFQRDPEWWEEVALLYAAQLENIHRQDFFDRLYSESVAE
jgi:predicted NACHT family NTPase